MFNVQHSHAKLSCSLIREYYYEPHLGGWYWCQSFRIEFKAGQRTSYRQSEGGRSRLVIRFTPQLEVGLGNSVRGEGRVDPGQTKEMATIYENARLSFHGIHA
jgi:hypothetical protein